MIAGWHVDERHGGPLRDGASGPALRVLIVDDDADTCESVAILLGHWGFEAKAVRSGLEALPVNTAYAPDVILLDIAMPGMDGLELTRRLRQVHSRAKRPFLVAVSGYADAQTCERAREAGIDLYLVKPVDPVQLEMLLRRFHTVVMPPADRRFGSPNPVVRRTSRLIRCSDRAMLDQSRLLTVALMKQGNDLKCRFRLTADVDQQILLRRAWCERAELFSQEIEKVCQVRTSLYSETTS
jgi:CheY-like chemotaxis protein